MIINAHLHRSCGERITDVERALDGSTIHGGVRRGLLSEDRYALPDDFLLHAANKHAANNVQGLTEHLMRFAAAHRLRGHAAYALKDTVAQVRFRSLKNGAESQVRLQPLSTPGVIGPWHSTGLGCSTDLYLSTDVRDVST